MKAVECRQRQVKTLQLHVDDSLPQGRPMCPDTMQHAASNHTSTDAAQTNPQAHTDKYTVICTTTQKVTRTDKTHFSGYQPQNKGSVS